MLMSFITDYVDPNKPLGLPIRDSSKIFQRYIYGSFTFDAIALAPFYMIKLYRDRQKLLYIIKIIRLKKGFDNLDIL